MKALLLKLWAFKLTYGGSPSALKAAAKEGQ